VKSQKHVFNMGEAPMRSRVWMRLSRQQRQQRQPAAGCFSISLLPPPWAFLYAQTPVSLPSVLIDCAQIRLNYYSFVAKNARPTLVRLRFLLFFQENRRAPTTPLAHPLLLTFTGICSRQRGHLAACPPPPLLLSLSGYIRIAFTSQRKQYVRDACRPILLDGLSPAAVSPPPPD